MARSSAVRLDVFVLADIRIGDVAAPCHAAMLEGLAEAGYRVGVLPVAPAEIKTDPYAIDATYCRLFEEGHLRRLAPGVHVECGLALGLDARLFSVPLGNVCSVKADHRVITLERPADFASMTPAQLECVAESAGEVLGGPVLWAPTTRIGRDALSYCVPHWPTTNADWLPTVPSARISYREGTERARPTVGLGHHARARPGPWIVSVAAGARAFRSANVLWRLRAAPDADRPFWPQAAPIEVWPDDQIGFFEFLGKIDILANGNQAAEDPCPVEVLCALQSGVVPFLEPAYRAVFAGTAIYGRSSEVAQRALEFHETPSLAADLRASGKELIEKMFTAQAAVSRVRDLIGKPRDNPYAPAVHASPGRRVLFYSTNGIGLGHLTRQLAIARRLPAHLTPVFVSHSKAIDIVHRYGYSGEHLPYHSAYGERKEHWDVALTDALTAALDFYDPSALVFDGNVPFLGLMRALDARPDVARVWIRRAFWGANRDLDALDRGAAFDLVVEPGELAWARDDGPTVAYRPQALLVPPVRLLDGNQILDRQAACSQLALDPEHVNVLVALGSGNNTDTSRMAARTLAHLHGRSGVGTTLAEWRIAGETTDLPAGVTRLTEYPFGKFLNAFDFAVAAAGYNTFTEHMAEGLPTVWVPNEHAQQDRQILRARFAEANGLGCLVRHRADFGLKPALDRLLDPGTREVMRAAHAGIAQHLAENGAIGAGAAIASLCETAMVRVVAERDDDEPQPDDPDVESDDADDVSDSPA
ncbi:glycosyltransferase [Roseibium sp.]|uniref:glycosyltransferase n=1 Tax=Roseibium sp. TaxID=1936156 RepID=UPI003B5028FC